MVRLEEPLFSFNQTIDECISGVTGNAALLQRLMDSKIALSAVETEYVGPAGTGELYTVQPANAGSNSIIIGTLTKSDLIKAYDQYFVPDNKPGRRIYDSLLNAAKERCPFCGGIGTPRNLDHYLPKAHFPKFSILPKNLVPCCRDCNMGSKAQNYSTTASDQPIHPYLDAHRFFLEQWIFAIYHQGLNGEPGYFEYFASPPDNWSPVDKDRVRRHFRDFELATRYGTKAAENLGTILAQIDSLLAAGLDRAVILSSIIQTGIDSSPFINHWQRGMYQALHQSLGNVAG
jgi:hypothetical protein